MYFTQGYWFDPKTGLVFDEDFNQQPFTFEDPPAGYHNPFNFATRETAQKVGNILRSLCMAPVEVVVEQLRGELVGPPQWVVTLKQGNVTSTHNAGLCASTLMRQYKDALGRIKYEMTKNGIA